MAVAVTDSRSVEDYRVIEQRPVAVWCRSQFLQIVTEQFDVIRLNFGTLRHLPGSFCDASVNDGSERPLRVRSSGLFTNRT